MPKYDIPGRDGPLTIVRHHEYCEYRFELPTETDDPIAVELLRRAGAVEVQAAPRSWQKAKLEPKPAESAPEPVEEDKA
jgi:hypothetical protein